MSRIDFTEKPDAFQPADAFDFADVTDDISKGARVRKLRTLIKRSLLGDANARCLLWFQFGFRIGGDAP